MTIIDAINTIDALKPNVYTQDEKIKWLSNLDGTIKANIIDTHEDGEDIEFDGYDSDTALTTELLVGEPYDDIYLHWLESKIDYYNAEYVRYNNSITCFNDVYSNFRNYYNREHMPKGSAIKYY